MPSFDNNAELLFSKVFGRAPETQKERSFLASASQRKEGAALQGALEFAQQEGTFAGSQQGASTTQSPAQQTSGGSPSAQTSGGEGAVESALERAQQGIFKAQEKLQKANESRIGKDVQLKVREELLKSPAIQELLKAQGELEKDIQTTDRTPRSDETILPTTTGQLELQGLRSQIGRVNQIRDAFATSGQGISNIISNVAAEREQRVDEAKTEFDAARGVLSSIVEAQQAESLAKASRGTTSLRDIVNNIREEEEAEVPSFQEFVNEQFQQSIPVSNLTSEEKDRLQSEYENIKSEAKRGDPVALANEFERKAAASEKSVSVTDDARQQLGLLLSEGNTEEARKLVDSMGRPLPATQTQNLGEIRESVQILEGLSETIRAYENKFGPITGRIAQINQFDPLGQALVAQMNATRQIVGKALEGGVLRKEDEEKYKRILAKPSDLGSVADIKTLLNQTNVVNKYNNLIDTFSESGFNVSGFRRLDGAGTPLQIIQQGVGGDGGLGVGDTIDVGGQQGTIIEIID